MNKYISPSQLAQNLNVSKFTVYDWVYDRKIPFVKIGKLVRFNEEDIEKWLKEKTIQLPS